jgi:hypothetical protein
MAVVIGSALLNLNNNSNMGNKLTHFAIHIDDMDRAKRFYEDVFDWGFASYGATDFLQIKSDRTENGELIGALQSRNYSPVADKIIGLECTIGVSNLDETTDKVKNNGGQILMPKTAIPWVGWIVKFLDTEGNLVCAMQGDPDAR